MLFRHAKPMVDANGFSENDGFAAMDYFVAHPRATKYKDSKFTYSNDAGDLFVYKHGKAIQKWPDAIQN